MRTMTARPMRPMSALRIAGRTGVRCQSLCLSVYFVWL
mgnify:CR=1 FL=1|jgi:hypothetical protein